MDRIMIEAFPNAEMSREEYDELESLIRLFLSKDKYHLRMRFAVIREDEALRKVNGVWLGG